MKKIKYEDRINTLINDLNIVSLEYKKVGKKLKRNRPFYNYICSCGISKSGRADHILNGLIKSCGCKSKEMIRVGHTKPGNQAAINRIYKTYLQNANGRKLSFNLDVDSFKLLIFDNCYYCGTKPRQVKLKRSINKIGNLEYYSIAYNGIDRVDSNFGYSGENCVTCCPQCNYAKSDLSLEDFKKWMNQLIIYNLVNIK